MLALRNYRIIFLSFISPLLMGIYDFRLIEDRYSFRPSNIYQSGRGKICDIGDVGLNTLEDRTGAIAGSTDSTGIEHRTTEATRTGSLVSSG